MKRAALAVSSLTVALAFTACAQVLGYDEYTARSGDAAITTTDGGAEVTDAITEEPTDADPGPARPPARPALDAAPSGKGRTLWFAIKRMFVGSMTSLGVSGPNAWREWGFDLDNVCTSVDDSVKNIGTCQRHPEANQDFLVDGDHCRDNNFGRHVVALMMVSSEGFESRINEGILEGGNTWLMRIDDVDDGEDDGYAPAKLYRASSDKGVVPKWDGTDIRKILSDSIVDRDLDKPLGDFPKGYIRGNVWVSGEPVKRKIVLPVSSDLFVPLELEAAVFTVNLGAGNKAASRGHMGGAIPMNTIETLLRPIASSAGFCPGTSLYQSLLRNVQRFPDVVIGAPNLQDTSVQCDGLSMGFGFDVSPIQPVTEIVDPPAPKPDPCTGDAG